MDEGKAGVQQDPGSRVKSLQSVCSECVFRVCVQSVCVCVGSKLSQTKGSSSLSPLPLSLSLCGECSLAHQLNGFTGVGWTLSLSPRSRLSLPPSASLSSLSSLFSLSLSRSGSLQP